jgi:hypothetical protein
MVVTIRGLPRLAIKVRACLCGMQLNVVVHRIEGEKLAAAFNGTLGVG